jgi:ubiquinone/menaquinone biosynthesis C-methylase UbiE
MESQRRPRANPKAASPASSARTFPRARFSVILGDVDPIESSRDRRPAQIAEYFARLAETYGDGAYYGNRRSAVLDAIVVEIAGAREVLDVGCGNGAYLTKFVAAAGNRRVTGVDLSFDMLLSARGRVGAKCRLLRGNVSRLPFKQESFDFIFASHVLQFIADADLDGAVAEFARCLQRDGVMIATGQRDDGVRQTLSAIVGPERWREYREVIFRRAARREADALPKDRYQRAFAKAGLRVEERTAPFTVTWPDIAEWIRIRWMPLIPADERERAESMIAELAQTEASRSVTQREPLIIGHLSS